MGQLQEEIEDAEFNISDFEAQEHRSALRALDFQAIADDLTQPLIRREKFAVYAMQERAYIDAAKENRRRTQLRLDDLLREQRAEKAERESELNRAMGYPMESFPSLKRVTA